MAGDGGLVAVDTDATFAAFALRPGSTDLAAADASGKRILLYSGFAPATLVEDVADPEALAFSADGATLLAAAHGAEALLAIDMAARTVDARRLCLQARQPAAGGGQRGVPPGQFDERKSHAARRGHGRATAGGCGGRCAMKNALITILGGTLLLPAAAQSIRTNPEFQQYSIPANDDGSSDLVSLPFTVNFFGRIRTSAYVNNNGNITF